MSLLCTLITFLGIFTLYKIVYRLWIILIYPCYVCKEFNLLERYRQNGERPWALITGSTDGIGLAFAKQLAKRGFNIILFGRNEQKAIEKEAEVKAVNPAISVKRVIRDFSKCGEDGFFEGIYQEVKELDIGIVVNNVGISQANVLGKFEDKLIKETIIVNCLSQALITNKFISAMSTRHSRSAIIDISSLSGITPSNFLPVYASTKAFNKFLSIGMNLNGRYPNIDFQCLAPGFISTAMINNVQKNILVSSADECANGSLRCLGHVNYCYGSIKSVIHGIFLELVYLIFPPKIAVKVSAIPFLLSMPKDLFTKKPDTKQKSN